MGAGSEAASMAGTAHTAHTAAERGNASPGSAGPGATPATADATGHMTMPACLATLPSAMVLGGATGLRVGPVRDRAGRPGIGEVAPHGRGPPTVALHRLCVLRT